ARGEIIEIAEPERLTFTYGYASGSPVAPGASLVTIRLEAIGKNTRVHLTHAFSDAAVRDEHVQGWRYQLSLFSTVVSNQMCAAPGEFGDAGLAAGRDATPARRDATLARIAVAGVLFRDRFSNVEGLDDLSKHLDAAQRFMPGL